MFYDRSSTREKWTIMKYFNDFNLMTSYAYALYSVDQLTDENINNVLTDMADKNIYRPRNGGSIDTGKFKIIQLAWYMFGHYEKNKRNKVKRFIFTPLGELLINNISDEKKVRTIFLTMLYGNGFRQPFSKMDERFNLFPFRLFFKLIRDSRLEGRVYNHEMFYFTLFLKEINEEQYEELIQDILEIRTKNYVELYKIFKEDENVLAQSLHEWSYVVKLLGSAGILEKNNDDDNTNYGNLIHGNGTGRRAYRADYVTLNSKFINYIDKMNDAYSCFEKPYAAQEQQRKFNSEIVTNMYNFFPKELLEEIEIDGEIQHDLSELLSSAREIETLSTNQNDGDSYEFEEVLAKVFNIYIDVKAEVIGGAGEPDIECLYYMEKTTEKFDIEAKTRRIKLIEMNPARLSYHRERIGSKYTIIVTSDFTPGVLKDIKNDSSVIVRASVLSNYFYQYISKKGRYISYENLYNIISTNIGKDITNQLNEHIFSNFSRTVSVTEK